jgi:hypothetical protein
MPRAARPAELPGLQRRQRRRHAVQHTFVRDDVERLQRIRSICSSGWRKVRARIGRTGGEAHISADVIGMHVRVDDEPDRTRRQLAHFGEQRG